MFIFYIIGKIFLQEDFLLYPFHVFVCYTKSAKSIPNPISCDRGDVELEFSLVEGWPNFFGEIFFVGQSYGKCKLRVGKVR